MRIQIKTYLKQNYMQQYNLTSFLLRKINLNVTSKFVHTISTNLDHSLSQNEEHNDNIKLLELCKKYKDRILFNSVIEQQRPKLGYSQDKELSKKTLIAYKKQLRYVSRLEPLPYSLRYLNEKESECTIIKESEHTIEINENKNEPKPVTQFPFETSDQVTEYNEQLPNNKYISPEEEVSMRKQHYDEMYRRNWMTDYENYDDQEYDIDENFVWKFNYGTPDPKSAVSSVPCGGCGALLHCKDTAIPGYIPSEIYKNNRSRGGQHLNAIICQRCHFLKYYNMALQVRVSADDYPKILEKIKENKNALVLLMVDLLDFPCSVWPNIMNVIGRQKPIIIVGNKVDLLPQDSKGYLERIKTVLINQINNSNLVRANILNVSLISAKTGYGIEELITKLHSIWKFKGDVYLVGCTNVGKSTLFNVLLQSDYCKVQAVDLIQRATTSLWPGTTLNLLKFPILRPSGWRLYVRTKRLISLNKLRSQEERLRKSQLKETQNHKYATLMGHIERTFIEEDPVPDNDDMFAIKGHGNASGRVKVGVNENDIGYKLSRWCYDTPGVVQPDQILHLLTTDELMLTLPKQLIQPKTFLLTPEITIFIAGLGRLDYISGPDAVRFTVFTSHNLPVTICNTDEADKLYEELLGTDLFKVPIKNEDRLQQWPALQAGEEIKLRGVGLNTSCSDIVLSSAGWISVSLETDAYCILKAWTPQKRGIYVRDCLLPKAVALRGPKIRHSFAYRKTRFYINN